MTKLAIFDIDGVLFEPKHRYKDYMEGRYDDYFSKATTDEPIEAGLAACRMYLDHPDYHVLFVTGRGDSGTHRQDTFNMLTCHLNRSFWPKQLLMRKWPIPAEQDFHDSVVKPLMIQEAGWDLNRIAIVYEDRPSIVEMWRAKGITCYQTQNGW